MNSPLNQTRPQPGRRIAIALAVLVHVLLGLFLIYGVHWAAHPPQPVEVDLVRPTAPPLAKQAPEPTPPPAPPQQQPEKTAPSPPAPSAKADLVVKQKPPRPAAPPATDFSRALADETRQLDEQRNAAAAAAEIAQLHESNNSALNTALAAWSNKIANKIKGNLVRPATASGNPVAVYEVTLLPDGNLIGEPRLKRSTGDAALDAAIERAIRKSAPLPKPDNPALFQRVLELTFRPLEK